MLEDLAKKIQHLNYVVQRNWQNLPLTFKVGSHDDLDLFVSPEDKEELFEILKDFDYPIDVRFPGDGYYPLMLCAELLRDRRTFNGFYIPSEKAAFLTLYYHNEIHKRVDQYSQQIRRLFFEWIPPTKCKDEGVGYFV